MQAKGYTMQRYVQVPYGDTDGVTQYARFEVLEAFTGSKDRQFNMRRKGGLGMCEGAEIIRALENAYGFSGMVGEIHPLAGDLCVIFKEPSVESKPVPTGNDGGADGLHDDAPAPVSRPGPNARPVQGRGGKSR